MKLELSKITLTPAVVGGLAETTKELENQATEFANYLNEKANQLTENPELVETLEKETKKEIAATNKQVKAVKDKAKEIADMLIPQEVKEFQETVKKSEKIVSEAINNLKAPIKEATEKRLFAKKEELEAYFDFNLPEELENKITFDMLGIKVIQSTSIKKYEEIIDAEITRISETVELIKSNQNREILLNFYFNSGLDYTVAKNKLNEYLAAKELETKPQEIEIKPQVVEAEAVVAEKVPTVDNAYQLEQHTILTIRIERSKTFNLKQMLAQNGATIISEEIE